MDDDVSKQFGAVETAVSETKLQVGAIAATLPHLATKDDVRVEISAVRVEVAEVKAQVAAIVAVIPHLATKGDLKDVKMEVGAIAAVIPHLATKADLAELSEKLIKWLIATGIATTGLIAAAMKFVR
jgi:GTP:adenosylcobinamide-phosphate guanylyltransferase